MEVRSSIGIRIPPLLKLTKPTVLFRRHPRLQLCRVVIPGTKNSYQNRTSEFNKGSVGGNIHTLTEFCLDFSSWTRRHAETGRQTGPDIGSASNYAHSWLCPHLAPDPRHESSSHPATALPGMETCRGSDQASNSTSQFSRYCFTAAMNWSATAPSTTR